ncbi:MAG: restriction endonuclease subunit S [Veillonella parvula]|uniref:restriction endonuclease subunit S n=1 Tax=Veillonella parvula TaxID=29466 RepID=UPI002908B494|nr:restriction endonuclease subunit S [Veillonella parvula]MDU6637894.1 restriction endonuclease subunit S [Veillonella parvula]
MTPQQLRNSILQLAIEGKLVEQRPEEGTGEELYQLIQEEKQELIKVGKLKKQKNLPEIMKDEMPFLIPNTWRWVRLKEIVYNRGQKKPTSKFWYIDISSIDNTRQKLKQVINIIDAENAPSRARRIVDVGDILYSTVRPYLHNMCIIDSTSPFESIASTGLAAMTCYNKVYNKYLFYYLLSASFDQYANSLENSKGVAYPAINDERLYKAVIPLPPVDEQKRIVEKIEVIFPLIDRYEGVWHKLNELNKTFPETLQKSILQEAIQGKLCEQKDEDGSAKELIEKISLEKERLIESGQIKKHKALPAIQEDEIPFDIPSSWCWERLGNISTYNQTKPKIKAIDLDRLIWVLDLDDIEKNTGKILRYVKAKDKKVSGEKVVFHKGQILYSKLRPYLKKALIAPEDGVCTPELVPFDIFGGCNRNYILSVLKSPYVDFGVNSATYGVKMPRVGVETMINLLIPIPPIREQERIVKKFDKSHSLIQRFKDLVFV